MKIDRLSKHYMTGFVKQCYTLGLTEDQTAQLLDERLKSHLATTNEHYREGIKVAMEKSAAPGRLGKFLVPLGLAGGGSVLGGAGLNLGPEGLRNLSNEGVHFNLGNQGPEVGASGNALGALAGGALGGLSMLRKGTLKNLRRSVPFSRATVNFGHMPGAQQSTRHLFNPAKLKNVSDLGVTGAHVGAGALGGYFAPKVQQGIADRVDNAHQRKLQGAKSMLENSGLFVSDKPGTQDPITPWYANLKGGETDMSQSIPNLSLLPQEVQDAARNTGSGGGQKIGPNYTIDQAGKRIADLDTTLEQARAVVNDPNQSPVARYQAHEMARRVEAERNAALASARSAATRMRQDQAMMQQRRLEEQAAAASQGKQLGGRQDTLEQGPQPTRGSLFRGNTPTRGEHESAMRALEEQLLRNQQRQWELENMQIPELISPESQQLINTHGL